MMENTTVQVRSGNGSCCLEVSEIRKERHKVRLKASTAREMERITCIVELPVLSPSDSSTARISANTKTCYRCALRNFKELAYLYRRDIPCDDLPGRWESRVENRSDLYTKKLTW